MRSLVVLFALAALLPIQTAYAQTPNQQPPSSSQQGYVEDQHPGWFHETYVYRPCPAAVVYSNGRAACLGRP